MIYVYAITERDASAPGCHGLDDSPVRIHRGTSVGAAYSAHPQLDCRPEPRALWRHEEVVERLMGHGPVLPARFGTTFGEVEALARALVGNDATLQAQLQALRGCVELAVRVRPADASQRPVDKGPDRADGRDYLGRLLAGRRERDLLAARAVAPLSRLAVDSRRADRGPENGTVTASFLVRRRDVERFVAEVQLLQVRHGNLLLSCTGPWAPYSFAGSAAA